MKNLIFLKLGGSLITDKAQTRMPRLDRITRIIDEIKKATSQIHGLKLVLGHGSGSFGHVAAARYGTRKGVDSSEGWRGFVDVWYQAAALNRILLDSMYDVGLPGISFPVSGAAIAQDGRVIDWNLAPIEKALAAGLIPVVYGDVVFDQVRGGTILSTEDIFVHLARRLHPNRILLAGIDEGVWEDFPTCTRLLAEINTDNWEKVLDGLMGSAATDVTGGMKSKVRAMLDLVGEINALQVVIFNGGHPGNLIAAIQGEMIGTRITQ